MGIRDFDAWLETPVVIDGDPKRKKTAEDLVAERDATEARLRFRSLWYDMRQYIEEQGYCQPQNRARLAAYVVWCHTPTELRPVRFQKDLALQLGMPDDENFRKWRRQYSDLFSDESITGSIKNLIMESIPDVIMASIDCATNGGYQGFSDRRMLSEIAGVYKQRAQADVAVTNTDASVVIYLPDNGRDETITDTD